MSHNKDLIFYFSGSNYVGLILKNAWAVIFEISGFDYVGLILKIDRYGLLRVKNR